MANPTQDSMRLTATTGVRAPEVMSVGTDPITHMEKQEDLFQEQQYTIGRITFVVEPRFKDTAKETLGSILLKLMQNEVST